MLYQERILGRGIFWSRLAAGLSLHFSSRRASDLDLLAVSRHLRRDIGIDEGQNGRWIRDLDR